MRFIDTNIIVRFLVAPQTPADQTRHQAVTRLFQRLQQGLEQATTTEAVIAEVLYVLTSKRLYNLSHDGAAARLRPILQLRGFRVPHKLMYLRALDLIATHAFLDFGDAVIAAQMQRQRIRELYSYDRDFDQVRGVRRLEP